MASRVAKYPVEIPAGVEITLNGNHVTVKGKNGSLTRDFHPLVSLKKEDNLLQVVSTEDTISGTEQSGTSRALLQNMVVGVTEGFRRKLLLVGVGYRAQVQGSALNLSLGFSHPVAFPIPEGITIVAAVPTEIVITGADKQQVGQVAANIRSYRPPEPYKGKGIRYSDEKVIIKETKKKK